MSKIARKINLKGSDVYIGSKFLCVIWQHGDKRYLLSFGDDPNCENSGHPHTWPSWPTKEKAIVFAVNVCWGRNED